MRKRSPSSRRRQHGAPRRCYQAVGHHERPGHHRGAKSPNHRRVPRRLVAFHRRGASSQSASAKRVSVNARGSIRICVLACSSMLSAKNRGGKKCDLGSTILVKWSVRNIRHNVGCTIIDRSCTLYSGANACIRLCRREPILLRKSKIKHL